MIVRFSPLPEDLQRLQVGPQWSAPTEFRNSGFAARLLQRDRLA